MTRLVSSAIVAAVALAAFLPASFAREDASAGTPLGNSRENAAVLVAGNLAPGDSRSRTVTIANEGTRPAPIALGQAGLREQAGHGGGRLSARLRLRVVELRGGRPPALVYHGSLRGLSRSALGRFAPGETRTYRFTATLPDGGAPAGDNAYMGASASLSFRWSAAG